MRGIKKPISAQAVFRPCVACGKEFRIYPSTTQRYCSYECHLRSGGALRAGLAASAAMKKYGAKKDANHREVLDEMRKHVHVYDMSDFGRGVPDGVAWVADSWQFFDIKNPKTAYGRRGLNPIQQKWVGGKRGGPVFLIHNVEEARKFALGDFDGLKFESGDSMYLNAA